MAVSVLLFVRSLSVCTVSIFNSSTFGYYARFVCSDTITCLLEIASSDVVVN